MKATCLNIRLCNKWKSLLAASDLLSFNLLYLIAFVLIWLRKCLKIRENKMMRGSSINSTT